MPVVGGPTDHSKIRRAKTHLIPFTDHSGNPARVIFEGLAIQPLLPQLYMFAVYFTHIDATPDSLNGLLNAVHYNDAYPLGFRLEVFFLPGATEDDCICHYLGEKAARGDYKAQIEAVDNPTTATFTTMNSPPSAGEIPEGGSLPGMVPTYSDRQPVASIGSYDELLFICPEKNWSDGDQIMHSVHFDHTDPETYNRKLGGQAELEEMPPLRGSTSRPINDKSLACRYGKRTISEEMFDAIHRENEETVPPFQMASKSGWVCW